MKQLEFMDCGQCGKRVAITARRCGHCGQAPHGSGGNSNLGDSNESEEHHAVGGYTAEEDFDYDEFTEEESADNKYTSTKRDLWWYVALFFLIFYSIAALWPVVNQ